MVNSKPKFILNTSCFRFFSTTLSYKLNRLTNVPIFLSFWDQHDLYITKLMIQCQNRTWPLYYDPWNVFTFSKIWSIGTLIIIKKPNKYNVWTILSALLLNSQCHYHQNWIWPLLYDPLFHVQTNWYKPYEPKHKW